MLSPPVMDFPGVFDKHQIVEEPDEGNLSRPVLKTSRWGDLPAEFTLGCANGVFFLTQICLRG